MANETYNTEGLKYYEETKDSMKDLTKNHNRLAQDYAWFKFCSIVWMSALTVVVLHAVL